eukprot:m.107624 g.107624  ORF g.107624 m.107624 type:complete len:155 (-) comp9226_c0_seq8:278-742(-)
MSLCKAAEQGNAELVTQLLQTGANINRPGGHAKNSPLHFAAIGGHGAVVELLLAHGADATQTDINGYTPLHCAAIFGHENVAALLAAVEGDIVGRPDDRGWTPLHYAVFGEHLGTVKLLLGSGAPANARNHVRFNTSLSAIAGCREQGWMCFLR